MITKRAKELQLLHEFLRKLAGVTFINVQQPEPPAPDVIALCGERRIGIESTCYYQHPRKGQESERDLVVADAKQPRWSGYSSVPAAITVWIAKRLAFARNSPTLHAPQLFRSEMLGRAVPAFELNVTFGSGTIQQFDYTQPIKPPSMATIPVHVKRDHIQALVATKRPILALAEMIWNGFDADADRVSVRFDYNALDSLECIRIADNGTGIDFDEAGNLFGNLGGSWKSEQRKTKSGRSLHGKSGKGRFRAFALGSLVEWKTCSRRNGHFANFAVKGIASDLESFELTNPEVLSQARTGTEVSISNVQKNFVSLTSDDAAKEIAKYFAVYLSEYPNLQIDYAGEIVDPRDAQLHRADYHLKDVKLSNGKKIDAELTVIEWLGEQERALHLCDARGISLHVVPPGIKAPGFQFTAYLKSDYLRDLDKEGLLDLEDLHLDVAGLLAAAKAQLKGHFRTREAESAQELLREWKEDKIYPYEGDPVDGLETAERQVFDVVAVNLNAYLDDFDEATNASKRFTFKLIKQALKENPESLQRIFDDVLKLPKERQDDLAELLKKTSLTSIISSAKTVADRLNFLRGLQILLFDKVIKERLLERDQLHKILASETWIFGENFHLTSNEDTLEEVLLKHLERLGKRVADDSEIDPVEREHGRGGRVDLMLARSIPQPRPDESEYLIVELKRPTKKVDLEVLAQVKSYAMAVAKDERFRHTRTRWTFWVVSNEMTEEAISEANQGDRASGIVYTDAKQSIVVWAKTWGQLIQESQGRLQFYREHLAYEADRESAKEYLKRAYEKYIPTDLIDPAEEAKADEDGVAEASLSSTTAPMTLTFHSVGVIEIMTEVTLKKKGHTVGPNESEVLVAWQGNGEQRTLLISLPGEGFQTSYSKDSIVEHVLTDWLERGETKSMYIPSDFTHAWHNVEEEEELVVELREDADHLVLARIRERAAAEEEHQRLHHAPGSEAPGSEAPGTLDDRN